MGANSSWAETPADHRGSASSVNQELQCPLLKALALFLIVMFSKSHITQPITLPFTLFLIWPGLN